MAKVERMGEISRELLLEFFRDMLLIRRFEEKVEERFRAGELPGFLHVAIGQEATAVGVCRALEDGDVIASTHRAHGHALAKGTSPNAVMAELYGKAEGCSRGYGGSMHLYDIEHGLLGANAVIGGGLPGIVGSALAFQLRGEAHVALAFFGDGATNIGTFHEALNLGQLWRVPAVFVCENNRWAESTPATQHMPDRGPVPARSRVRDGHDQRRRPGRRGGLREGARSGRARALRERPGLPALRDEAVLRPLRWRSAGVPRQGRGVVDAGAPRPARRARERLELSDEELEELEREIHGVVEGSVEFAKNGTDPAPEDALRNVYA